MELLSTHPGQAGQRVMLERERCKGCYLCISECPNELFEPDGQANEQNIYPVKMVDAEYCINCLRCVAVCPEQALLPPSQPGQVWPGYIYWLSLKWHERFPGKL